MNSSSVEHTSDATSKESLRTKLELVIHVWPSRWDLPSFTPECLAAVLYAQLAIPGKFVVQECTNPDESPNGQLPYLTHGLACVASFLSIVKYINGLHGDDFLLSEESADYDEPEFDRTNVTNRADLSVTLSAQQRAQETAWLAFVYHHLGDLVACSFFTLRHNYHEFFRPALSELFSVPQRYYVPDRLRAMYKPRLQAAGLWTVQTEESEGQKHTEEQRLGRSIRNLIHDSAIVETFGKEKVVEKARTTLGILSRLLGTSSFYFDSDRPTTLDVLVAAHILLLTQLKFPNDVLSVLVESEFPSLTVLARRVQTRALGPGNLPHTELAISSASVSSYYDIVGSASAVQARSICVRPVREFGFVSSVAQLWPVLRGRRWQTRHHVPITTEKNEEEEKEKKRYDRMRWAWYGLSALCVLGWLASNVRISIGTQEDEEKAIEETPEHDLKEKQDEQDKTNEDEDEEVKVDE